MPFGGALFWGQAAQQTDKSMQEWERLWQVEQERLSREEMQQDQQRFELDVQLRRERFEERMAEAEQNFQMGLVDRNEQFQLGQEALDRMGEMSLDQQWATVEWLERSGNPVSSLARQTVRSGLFQNPQEAISLIDSVFTSPLGTKFNPTFVNMGLDVVIGMTGMSEDEADAFRTNVQNVLDQRAGEAEELDLAGMESTRLALQQARADIVQTGAQTGGILATTDQIRAQTAQIYQNIDVTDEQRALHLNILQRTVDDMDATIRIKGLEATAQEVMNGYLPSQLNADLHRTWAETQEVENRNDLYTRTVEYVVDEMAARTGLAEEDLRFALATSATREAIVNGDHEFLMANIDMLRTQEENVRANTALTGTQQQVLEVGMDETRLRMNESRVRMLSELTAAGDVSLLEAGGAQLLRDMGFDDVTAARVLEDLSGVATSNRSHALQLEEANVILALEEAEYARATTQDRIATTQAQRGLAEFELETAPQRLEFERWATEEGFRIDWAHVDIAREGLQVEREAIAAANARAAAGAGKSAAPIDMLNDVRVATGIDLKEFNTLQSAMETATNDLNYFRGLMANGNVQEISDYLTSVGVSPENHMEHLASLEAQQQSATRAYAGAISSYISTGVTQYGQVFTPQQLGITTELGMEAYREVLPYAAPGVMPVSEEEQNAVDEGQAARIAEVKDAVYRMSSTLAREAGENGLSTIVGANEMYQRLMAEYGPERLEEAGIFSPDQLGNDLGNQVVDYQRNVEAAMDGLNLVTSGNPQQIDARDPQALNSAATFVNSAAGQLTAFKETLDAIPVGAQNGLSFLGIGTSSSPERGQAARQLVALTSGFITPWELHSRGIIHLDTDGNVQDYLHVAGAKRLVDEISARMYQSAGAIRWLAANGGIR